MRATAIIIMLFLVMTPLSILTPSASADAYSGQYLWPTGPYGNMWAALDSDESFATALTPLSKDDYEATGTWTGNPEYGYDANYYDTTPGSLWFGQSLSDKGDPAEVGTFGICDVRVALTDLTAAKAATADYWALNIRVFAMVTTESLPVWTNTYDEGCSMYVGWGLSGESQSQTAQWLNDTPLVHHEVADLGSQYMYQSLLYASNHPADSAGIIQDMTAEPYGRPFSTAEINDAYLWLRFRFDQGVTYTSPNPDADPPYRFKLGFVVIYAEPDTEYSPPSDPGSFILWPDDDVQNAGWINYTTDDREGCYGTMNESGWFGDGNESYSRANYGSTKLLRLGFTDVPDGVPATARFTVSVHIIARIVAFPSTAYIISHVLASSGEKWNYSTASPMYQWWMNYSHSVPYSPDTGHTWTPDELDTLQLVLMNGMEEGTSTPGEMQITQVLAICTPTDDYTDYLPPSFDPIDYDDVHGWLATGGGLSTILAVMGGLGMFLAAPFIAMSVREGRYGAWEGIVLGIVIFVVGFALFIAGTAPWS